MVFVLICLFFSSFFRRVMDLDLRCGKDCNLFQKERSVCSGRPGDYLDVCLMGLGSVMLPVRANSVFPQSLLPSPATSHNMPLGGGGYENFLLIMCDSFIISLLIALYSYQNK